MDTSALIKLLIEEPGSDDAADIWDGADVVTSAQLIYPGARAALAAARRHRRLDVATHGRAVSALDAHHAQLRLIDLDTQLARRAGALAEEHGLRGYDAVHLASALAIQASDVVLMVTWDAALSAAAQRTGTLHVNRR